MNDRKQDVTDNFIKLALNNFGSTDPFSDAEMMILAYELCEKLGLKDLTLNINTIGCKASKKLISEKIKQFISPYLSELSDQDKEKFHKAPLRLMDSKDKKIQTFLSGMPDVKNIISKQSQEHFLEVLSYLDTLKIPYHVNHKLVRGLDYYTETVFEITSSSLGAQNAVCGGGRYNHLVKELGGIETPAMGCAFGIERLIQCLTESKNIDTPAPLLYFVPLGHPQKQTCFKYLYESRRQGITSEIGLSYNLKSELKKANKLGCNTVIIYGEDEAENQQFLMKNMQTGTQEKIDIQTLFDKVKIMTNPFNIIPAIDILNGQLVRLSQGSYSDVETYDITPIEIAKKYENNGAKRIHIVDLDGAKDGRLINHNLLKEIRESVNCDIEFGGGVRNQETVHELLDLGINYVILGSLLIKDKALSFNIIKQFPKKIIAGIDAKEGYVATEGWIEKSIVKATTLAEELNDYPLESIIYTDIAKDGMMSGPNIQELSDMASVSECPIIASGGIRNQHDIEGVSSIDNISGCIIGKAVISGSLTLNNLWNH